MLAVVSFLEHILLQMGVRREIYGGEWYVAQEACAGTFVQTDEAELSNNVSSTLRYSPFKLRSLALHLQPDFAVGYQQPSISRISR